MGAKRKSGGSATPPPKSIKGDDGAAAPSVPETSAAHVAVFQKWLIFDCSYSNQHVEHYCFLLNVKQFSASRTAKLETYSTIENVFGKQFSEKAVVLTFFSKYNFSYCAQSALVPFLKFIDNEFPAEHGVCATKFQARGLRNILAKRFQI